MVSMTPMAVIPSGFSDPVGLSSGGSKLADPKSCIRLRHLLFKVEDRNNDNAAASRMRWSLDVGVSACGAVMSSPETLGYVPSCARGLCPNPVGNRPGSPLTTLSSSTCGQSPVAVLGIAVAVSPRVGNCQLQASCLPSSGKSEAGQLSALLGHGSRQAVNRHLGTPTPVPISRSPGRGNCKRLPATESPVTKFFSLSCCCSVEWSMELVGCGVVRR